ncbi:response regulator transcription factor [Tropicimonas isoalkanivorans]|uniref:Two-component system, OmpR family, response regulator TctD n=1 Tax=Tropicimonas isoalkanivorans TaxID=441112 RepID=A0A1I1QYJ2_9RHOB|nr:response regulator transcription factor [Tropicimonas isoalkanivorans]SFD27194.1 two-component system, OmpR family, response regulator TctD [Tropicimonas isoalkanivorans]
MRVLLVEDAEDLAQAVSTRLARSGMACDTAPSLGAARDYLAVQSYDALVLDINLPDGSGKDLLRDLRRRGDRTPVMMLTALLAVDDRVSALDMGADDYLVKPFDQRELEARLRALVRREAEHKTDSLILGPLEFMPAEMSARLDGERLHLTRREAALLALFMRNPRQVLSKERLYDGLFAFNDANVGLNAIELYIARLRKKFAGSRISIGTQRGVGYWIDSNG